MIVQYKFFSSSSATIDSAPAHEDCPAAKDERHRHRPVATCSPPSPLSPTGSSAQFPRL